MWNSAAPSNKVIWEPPIIALETQAKNQKKFLALVPGTAKGDLLANFVDSTIQGKQPLVSAQQVLDASSVALAIDQSILSQSTLPVAYFTLNLMETKIPFGKPILEEEENKPHKKYFPVQSWSTGQKRRTVRERIQ